MSLKKLRATLDHFWLEVNCPCRAKLLEVMLERRVFNSVSCADNWFNSNWKLNFQAFDQTDGKKNFFPRKRINFFSGKPQPRVLWFRNGKVFSATTWTKRNFENGKTLIYSNISVDSLSRYIFSAWFVKKLARAWIFISEVKENCNKNIGFFLPYPSCFEWFGIEVFIKSQILCYNLLSKIFQKNCLNSFLFKKFFSLIGRTRTPKLRVRQTTLNLPFTKLPLK